MVLKAFRTKYKCLCLWLLNIETPPSSPLLAPSQASTAPMGIVLYLDPEVLYPRTSRVLLGYSPLHLVPHTQEARQSPLVPESSPGSLPPPHSLPLQVTYPPPQGLEYMLGKKEAASPNKHPELESHGRDDDNNLAIC